VKHNLFKCLVVCTAIYNVPFSSTHPSSLPVLSGVRITRSLILCVGFVDRCLSFCTFSFDHFVVCSSIYGAPQYC